MYTYLVASENVAFLSSFSLAPKSKKTRATIATLYVHSTGSTTTAKRPAIWQQRLSQRKRLDNSSTAKITAAAAVAASSLFLVWCEGRVDVVEKTSLLGKVAYDSFSATPLLALRNSDRWR